LASLGRFYASANASIEARQVRGILFFAKPAAMKDLAQT